MIWEEAVHMCEHVRNSMATTGITTNPFGNFYREKPKIIGSFSEFRHIGYVSKRDKFKNKMTEKNSRKSWWDILAIIRGTRTSCTTRKPR